MYCKCQMDYSLQASPKHVPGRRDTERGEAWCPEPRLTGQRTHRFPGIWGPKKSTVKTDKKYIYIFFFSSNVHPLLPFIFASFLMAYMNFKVWIRF